MTPHPSRRAVLLGALTAAAAGCTSGARRSGHPLLTGAARSAAVAAATAAWQRESALLAGYAANPVASPATAALAAACADDHRVHQQVLAELLRQLGAGSPRVPSATPPSGLPLRQQEQQAAAAHAAAARRATGLLAATLASLAASEAAHAAVLP